MIHAVDSVHCEKDIDEVWNLTWPRTLAGSSVSRPCPMEDTIGQ